jgi:anaerobic selenocysteine-containing dehydrogenase
MTQQIVKGNCGLCQGGCGVLAYIEDGRMVKVEGDPDYPTNHGILCPKGLASVQLVNSPHRLKYPLKRMGERGEGKWERITWDEALDTIATRLKEIRAKYGPLSVAGACGTGRPLIHHDRRFLNILETPNRLQPGHICYMPMLGSGLITFGKFPSSDFRNTRCILNWGSNVTHTRRMGMGLQLIEAWKRGAKLITVDPLLTPLASKSDVWLQLRPGTDCALGLAWLNVIIKERLYDSEFVSQWTYGFEQLAEHVEHFTPEWAEPITWVPAHHIRQAARLYATTSPATLYMGVSVEFGPNTTGTIRSLLFLPTLTGNIDIPGGNVLWQDAIPMGTLYSMEKKPSNWDNALGDYPLLNRLMPIAGHSGWRGVLAEKRHPVKAMLFHANNAIVGHENVRGFVYKAIMELEFLSVMDLFMTPTAELADIVLPASTPYERDNIFTPNSEKNYVPPAILAAPKVIEPLWESRDDGEVFIDILKRLGLDYGADTVKERLDQLCLKSAAGVKFDEFVKTGFASFPQTFRKYQNGQLRPDGEPGFNTPSGKVELFSSELQRLEIDPLPVYKEPPESPVSQPELASTYPLILTTGIRSPVYYHTQYRHIPWLREIDPEPHIRIHPETAQQYGIRDGDWVYIESPRGRCKQRARVTLGIDPRVVMADASWWLPEKATLEERAWEVNINNLTDSEPPHDPGFGSTSGRSLLCKICKAEAVQ